MTKKKDTLVRLTFNSKDAVRFNKGYNVYKMKNGVKYSIRKTDDNTKEIRELRKRIAILQRGKPVTLFKEEESK